MVIKSGNVDDIILLCIVTKCQRAIDYALLSVPGLGGRPTYQEQQWTLRVERFTTRFHLILTPAL